MSSRSRTIFAGPPKQVSSADARAVGSSGSPVRCTGWGSEPGGCATTAGRAAGTRASLPDRVGFQRSDTLALASAEARYLQDRVTQSVPGSLLAHLFLRAHPAECRFAWEHPDYAGFPPPHKAALEHARLFSEVIYGAPLLYNLLLARRAERDDKIAEYC